MSAAIMPNCRIQNKIMPTVRTLSNNSSGKSINPPLPSWCVVRLHEKNRAVTGNIVIDARIFCKLNVCLINGTISRFLYAVCNWTQKNAIRKITRPRKGSGANGNRHKPRNAKFCTLFLLSNVNNVIIHSGVA